MAKILIGVPAYKPLKQFLVSLSKFQTALSQTEHEFNYCWVEGYKLVDAQNYIAEMFLEGDWEYLLFLEEDHWGHTKSMLEKLIEANAHVASVKYYSRHYPFICCLLKYSGKKQLVKKYSQYPIHQKGYAECDLLPFGMTLIRRDTFNHLTKPYFRLNIFKGQEPIKRQDGSINNSIATDRNFSDRLRAKGIKLMGYFDECLTHNGINNETIDKYREHGNKLLVEMKLINSLNKAKGKPLLKFKEFWEKRKKI